MTEQRLRVCLVKQHTTYDLYTRTGPDLRSIVASSNWRAGPLGLWEAFDCEYRIVYESPDHECQIGKTQWEKYVEGWDIWPEGSVAERAEDIDWSQYDVVIGVDVAVPKRVSSRFPQTMWCYYFIEAGSTAVEMHRGNPLWGYNLFFTHRPALSVLDASDRSYSKMLSDRRAMLDFPYYMMSSSTISDLYGDCCKASRSGITMTFHGYQVATTEEMNDLASLGAINHSGIRLEDVHRDVLQSEYCVVHPGGRRISGLALVEAISGGCVALAPRQQVYGFPDLLPAEVDYSDFAGLLRVVERLQADNDLRGRVRAHQAGYVDAYFYRNPKKNLELMFEAFRSSEASLSHQVWSERRDRLVARAVNAGDTWRRRAMRATRTLS